MEYTLGMVNVCQQNFVHVGLFNCDLVRFHPYLSYMYVPLLARLSVKISECLFLS